MGGNNKGWYTLNTKKESKFAARQERKAVKCGKQTEGGRPSGKLYKRFSASIDSG